MMKSITYIFNTNATTLKNTIAELLGEDTLNNDNSKKFMEEIAHFIDKAKKEISLFLTM